MIDEEPADYLIVHMAEALALDGRTSSLGLDVRMMGSVICIDGLVADRDLAEAVAAVAADNAKGHPVQVDVAVGPTDEGDLSEDLR